MKTVLGLIYIPVASRSVARVKEFRRCPEHGNLLLYDGKALSVEEFNKAAQKTMCPGASSMYGVQPMAKLVEVEITDAVPAVAVPKRPVPAAAQPAPVAVPAACAPVVVEPAGDGFVLVNYEGEAARYMGESLTWEDDVSLIIPFATEDAARGAALNGGLSQESLPVASGASPQMVGKEAAGSPEPAASIPSVTPVVEPKKMREAIAKHQTAKRAAKAAK